MSIEDLLSGTHAGQLDEDESNPLSRGLLKSADHSLNSDFIPHFIRAVGPDVQMELRD
jgi:hypothetical protein